MDYEKKYKEALERARVWKEKSGMPADKQGILDDIFPELAGSEDEQIRKELTKHLKEGVEGYMPAGDSSDYRRWLDWLEKQGKSYTKRDVDDAWLKGMCDAKRELEKQSDSPIKWNKNTKDCKPKVSHSVLMKTTHGIAEGEWQGEHWHQYRWAGLVRDIDVLSWMELSDLEKQDEQNSSWSKEDDVRLQACIDTLQAKSLMGKVDTIMTKWLKSLKTRCTWKPSDEQMADLWNMLCECRPADHQLLQDIYYGLKKLKGG